MSNYVIEYEKDTYRVDMAILWNYIMNPEFRARYDAILQDYPFSSADLRVFFRWLSKQIRESKQKLTFEAIEVLFLSNFKSETKKRKWEKILHLIRSAEVPEQITEDALKRAYLNEKLNQIRDSIGFQCDNPMEEFMSLKKKVDAVEEVYYRFFSADDEFEKHLENLFLYDPSISYVKFPFNFLNKYAVVNEKDLVIIAGYTGIGKTFVLLMTLYETVLSLGRRCVFISTEMPSNKVLSRLLMIMFKEPFYLSVMPVSLSYYNYKESKTDFIYCDSCIYNWSEERKREAKKETRRIKEFVEFYFWDDRTVYLSDIVDAVKQAEQKFKNKVDVLFIDGFEFVKMYKDPRINEWQQQTDAIEAMEKFCKSYNITTIVTTQLKKEKHDAEVITLSDLYGRHDISKKASVVIAIAQTAEEKECSLARLFLLKNRNGLFIGNTFPVVFNPLYVVGEIRNEVELWDMTNKEYIKSVKSEIIKAYRQARKLMQDDSKESTEDTPF